jgi:hypothetical protein
MKRPCCKPPPPPEPTVPDFVCAPELAAVFVLERALDVVAHALLAEHPTLTDDFHRPHRGHVETLAASICRRAATLGETLVAYRRAVRDALASSDAEDPNADLPF